jgi:hypothetical protein
MNSAGELLILSGSFEFVIKEGGRDRGSGLLEPRT